MKKGFTLVELVITIAIVIILSVISVPIYQGYAYKAKMAEGYALMGAYLSAQKNYYSEYGYFHNHKLCGDDNRWSNYDPCLGIDARGNKYFTYFNIGISNGNEAGYIKYLFDTEFCKPSELITPGKEVLEIIYDITSGATVFEGPKH